MQPVYLLVSLLTPWLAGFCVLRAVEARAEYRPHLLRQLAFAFFLGYALVQLLILSANSLPGHTPVAGLNVMLVVLALCAHLIYRTRRLHVTATLRNEPRRGPQQRGWVFWFFLGLAAAHLLLAATEVLHRPIFPWDAWLSWMYRAKAWFLAGSIVPMDSPPVWLASAVHAPYNVAGAHYPSLVPITALWTALHLGYWSETLVSLPVIACGLALAAGAYGLCREAGRSPRVSMVAAYLLLSLPLISTHLSLAGQADIWMAGYAGLGLCACLLGLVERTARMFCIGLALVALSTTVKAEGGVWLVVALAAGAMTWMTVHRKWLYVLPLPALLLLAWATGFHFVELPVLGGVGVRDGILHASFLGSHRIERHDVIDDYWQNFFSGGSWHLLWPLLILAALSLLRKDASQARIVILAFLGAAFGAQAVMFGFTDQGRWAEDWTAINRIPLHIAPALVFCLVLAYPARAPLYSGQSHLRLLRTAAMAALMTFAIALMYLGLGFTSESGPATVIDASDFKVVMGEARLADGERRITRFQRNVALISSGPVKINADKVSLVSVRTRGENRNGQNLFWRTVDDPENLKMVQYEGRGDTYLRLADNPDWTGEVTEIGIVFYDDGGSLATGSMAVQPDSMATRVRQVVTEWAQHMPWSQKSTHWLPAGAPDALLPLPLLVSAWLILALGITAFATRQGKPGGMTGAAVLCLIGWLVLDCRWLINQAVNTRDTLADHAFGNSQPLRFGGDAAIGRVVENTTERLPPDTKALMITADDPRMRYQMLRAKYHALPYATYVHEGTRDALPAIDVASHLLVLKQPFRDPNAPPTSAREWQAFLAARNRHYRVVWESDEGFLLSRSPTARTGLKP